MSVFMKKESCFDAPCAGENHVCPMGACAGENHVCPMGACAGEDHICPMGACAGEDHICPGGAETGENHIRLHQLQPGQGALVEKLLLAEDARARLMELGLVPQTRVVCVASSPAGDPRAFLIRGKVVALRKAYSRLIEVKEEEIGRAHV